MGWLTICGKQDLALEAKLLANSEESLIRNNFPKTSLSYISGLNRSINLSGGSSLPDEVLIEKLRGLCKFWDVDPTISTAAIKSHRKYLGPVIVKSKSLLFSILRVLLKPAYEKQRKFNSQVIELLAEIIKHKT